MNMQYQDGGKATNATVGRLPWMSGSSDNDWPEDAPHENGNYFNKCEVCGKDFIGHKRRLVCRSCDALHVARIEKAFNDKYCSDL